MVTLHVPGALGRGESPPEVVSPVREAMLRRIETREATVAVIGMGYVGLPLAVAFAEAGFHVVGIDLDQRKVESLNAGRSYIADVPSEWLAALVSAPAPLDVHVLAAAALNGDEAPIRNGQHGTNGHVNGHTGSPNGHQAPGLAGTVPALPPLPASGLHAGPAAHGRAASSSSAGSLRATSDFDALHDVDAVIICVPTPVNHTKDPDVSYIQRAADETAERIHSGMLVVLESTTYPGTTEEIIIPRLTNGYARHCLPPGEAGASAAASALGREFFVAFSPERIDPGRTDWTVRTTPKVIGGATPACLDVARALYGCAVERVVPVSSTGAAEMVKLLENTFRLVNIGLINEVAIMCDRLGVNVWEVIDAAATKPFGFMPFYPGPGLGGHCIPVDPHYLAWKLKTLNYHARFIQIAAEINGAMPHHVLEKIADALNREGIALKGARVLVLGVAYKADIGDMRESPALDLIHLLRAKEADVVYHDPHVPALEVAGRPVEWVELTESALREADCVVIATAHRSYDWASIVEHSRLVVDTRNATRDLQPTATRIVRL